MRSHTVFKVRRRGRCGAADAARSSDPDISCRRKTAFLIGSLLGSGDPVPPKADLIAHARDAGIVRQLLDSLSPSTAHPFGPDGDELGDVDFEEKAVGALAALVAADRTSLEPDERRALADALRARDYGLGPTELASLRAVLE